MASSAHIGKIQAALFSGQLTLVVGAGISIGAVKYSVVNMSENDREKALNRLTWKGLLHSGLNYLKDPEFIQHFEESEIGELNAYTDILSRKKVSFRTLIRAASLLKAKLNNCDRLPDWLHLEFQNLHEKYIGTGGNVVLDAIRELYVAKARIMTTNYDDLLSRHCQTSSIVSSQEFPLSRFFDRSDQQRKILHVHGLWSEPNGAVLDNVDYFKVTQASSLQNSLRACLVGGSEVVLFVGAGAGLDDPNFGQLLDWASPMLGQGLKRHYILLLDTDKNERPYLNAVKYGPDHSSLPSFLCMLAQSGSQRFYYDVDSETHKAHLNRLILDDYRLTSLSVYGTPPAVRYAAIYSLSPGPPGPDWKAIQDADAEKYEQWYNKLRADGYVSSILTATGPHNGAVYAGVMVKLSNSGEWFQHRSMSATEFQINCNTARENGQMLVSFREYGDTSDRRYCAVWHANPNNMQWYNVYSQSYTEYQATFNAKIATPPWHLSYVTLSEDQRVSSLFQDTACPLWATRHGLIGPDLLLENRKYQNEGFSMTQLQGGGTAAETRFAALWLRKSGPS